MCERSVISFEVCRFARGFVLKYTRFTTYTTRVHHQHTLCNVNDSNTNTPRAHASQCTRLEYTTSTRFAMYTTRIHRTTRFGIWSTTPHRHRHKLYPQRTHEKVIQECSLLLADRFCHNDAVYTFTKLGQEILDRADTHDDARRVMSRIVNHAG
jgi:hypothetical protein